VRSLVFLLTGEQRQLKPIYINHGNIDIKKINMS
jgi:hypothetical protein